MSTWISDTRRRLALACAISLPLAGCMDEGTGGMGFLNQPGGTASKPPPIRQVALYNGEVIVAGPPGYCLDRQSLKRGAAGGFVLIASCESLSGKAGTPVDPAVMTVSVLPKRLSAARPTAAEIAAAMAPADVLTQQDGDDVSLAQLSDGGDQLLEGGDPRHWRGGLMINGHVVGLAVYGPEGSPIAGSEGRRLILALATTLRRQNAEPDD